MHWSKTTWASIPLLLFVGLALLRSDLVLHLGWLIRGWALVALIAFTVLLLPLFRSQRTWAFYLAMATHLLIYLVCLVGTWVAGATSDLQVAGIFPFSDAAGYVQDALFLIAGGDFRTTHRPLFSAMLATGLGWTNLNLKLVLIFLVAAASIASFLFAKQVEKFVGPLAAFIVLLLTFLFYRRFLGTFLTENLGLTLGLLGGVLLLQSLRSEKYHVVLATYGLFVLTMALFARAGAFLVLPAILFYFWRANWTNNPSAVSNKWYFVTAGLTVIAIAVGCNSLLRQWTGPSENLLFGNAAFSLYGMAAGYKGWLQIAKDHPELYGFSDSLVVQNILAATLNLIRDQPLQLVKAIVFAFGDFFVRLFGFAKLNFLFQDLREHLVLNLVVVILLNTGLFAGLVRLWRWRAQFREARFLLFTFMGIWLSAPFVPPIDADSMRAYAATFPFITLITAVGMAAVLGGKLPSETSVELRIPAMVAVLSAGLISTALLGPWSVRGSMAYAYPQVQQLCPADQKNYLVQTHPVLAVHLVESSGRAPEDYYPSTRVNVVSFKKNLDFNGDLRTQEELNKISSGSTIFLARNIANDRILFFLAATSEFANKKGVFSACGDPLQVPGGFTLAKLHSLHELAIP